MSATHLRLGLIGPLPPPEGGMANQTRQLARLLGAEGIDVRIARTNGPCRPAWLDKLRGWVSQVMASGGASCDVSPRQVRSHFLFDPSASAASSLALTAGTQFGLLRDNLDHLARLGLLVGIQVVHQP